MPTSKFDAKVAFCFAAAVAVAAAAQEAPPAAAVHVRLAASPVFAGERAVEIAEALMVPTISVFAGKTGMVRQRSGRVAPFVVLSSRKLGCGRIQSGLPPAWGLTKKAAAAMEARLAPTRPRASAAPVEFVPTEPADFEIVLVGSHQMRREELDAIESDSRHRPAFYFQLLRPSQNSGEMHYLIEQAYWKAPAGSLRFEKELKRDEKSAVVVLSWQEERLLAEINVNLPEIMVRGNLPLELCPPLEHIHVEPK